MKTKIIPVQAGTVLKISIFATGMAGIVAEFVLSTLATYIIGNAIFQWTVVMSLMFFAMGLGSRLSSFFRKRLLETFILVEFLLSVLCASSVSLSYGLSAFTTQINLIIYALAMAIGFLIGLEIPLVTRLNQSYEELRSNIATIMEKDYYGSLLGGLLFAFFALPVLGLTYTPVALGAINFLVAGLVLINFYKLIELKKTLVFAFTLTAVCLIGLGILAEPVILFGEQSQYKDKIVYSQQTAYQKLVITRWKDHHWLFINGQEQFSSYDEERYHEPLIHPGMGLTASRKNILILGGGDGMALREILKYKDVESVTLVDLDPAMTDLAATHRVLTDLNQGSMNDPRLTIINQDANKFLRESSDFYGFIVVDLPDPDSVDLMHVYSLGFYELARKRLTRGGMMAVQATSPYFARDAFLCIRKTIASAGFSTLPYHNYVPTMGEWGFVLAARGIDISDISLKKLALNHDYDGLDTRFFNTEAMISMTHFGKGILDGPEAEEIEINRESSPVLLKYYLSGSWGFN